MLASYFNVLKIGKVKTSSEIISGGMAVLLATVLTFFPFMMGGFLIKFSEKLS